MNDVAAVLPLPAASIAPSAPAAIVIVSPSVSGVHVNVYTVPVSALKFDNAQLVPVKSPIKTPVTVSLYVAVSEIAPLCLPAVSTSVDVKVTVGCVLSIVTAVLSDVATTSVPEFDAVSMKLIVKSTVPSASLLCTATLHVQELAPPGLATAIEPVLSNALSSPSAKVQVGLD